jgi:hypothetical protein
MWYEWQYGNLSVVRDRYETMGLRTKELGDDVVVEFYSAVL